uniref:Uncharacterized protein n=1 Tax=Anopheles farauti TaxID=69004 RepID=A0A182QY34_9DIPT
MGEETHGPYLEQPLDLILDGLLFLAAFRYLAHQLVDRGHDFLHLLLGDASVTVDVVQRERPLQLLVHGAPQQDRQVGDEFLGREEKKTTKTTERKLRRFNRWSCGMPTGQQ